MKSRVFLVTLSFMCAVQLSTAQDYTPVCDPSNYTDKSNPPLPDFPRQFSFTIEAVLGSRNSTLIVSEYFDDIGNRGRVNTRFNGTDLIVILDYNLQEVFIIPDLQTGGECTVLDPTNSVIVNRSFGIEDRNGTLHIGSPVRFIELIRDESATRFIGDDVVRGIPVRRWQTCTSLPNNSYTVDYYFTPRTYSYNGESNNFDDDDDLLPIQFVLTARRINGSDVLNYVHMYNFYNFKSGPDSVPNDVFAVPNGLRCKGRIEGPPVPEIPKFFTLYAEVVGDYANRLDTFRETYDLTHKLLRIDSYYDGTLGGSPGPSSIIHDFDIGVEYAFNRNILNCQVQRLSESPYVRFDIDFNEEQEAAPQLITPNQFFLRGNEFNYSYEGVTTVRGMEVDSWISVRDFEQFQDTNGTNVVYEIFFTRPGWTVTSDLSQTTDPVPVRIIISGTFTYINRTDNSTGSTNASMEIDIFDYSASEPPYDAFDVSFCYGPDDYHFLLLAIPGHKENLDYGLLKRNVRMSISNLTGLRPIQVGKIEIRGENSTHVFVSTHLYNLTMFADIDPKTNVTADWAFDYIVNSTRNDSQLPFTLTIAPNLTVNPFLFHFGRGRNGSCNVTIPTVNNNCNKNCTMNMTTVNNNCTKNCSMNITTQLKLTDGVVAGIAIALFFSGMIIGILGLLVCCCIVRWYKSGSVKSINPVKYKRHDDELDVD